MSVRIVTDSTSCVPSDLAERLGITVLDIHVNHEEKDTTTAGLSALELVAAYARQLERGHDEGVLALHMSKEISSTWSAAVTAAGVFDEGAVRVVDTQAIGPGVGIACIVAAQRAAEGADLDACYDAALATLKQSALWFYVHKVDELRKSGRLSTANVLYSATLAIRPILELREGRVEIAAKTRTQTKALSKLADLVIGFSGDEPVTVIAIQHEARESAQQVCEEIRQRLHPDSLVQTHRMDPALATHTGPGTIAISVVRGNNLMLRKALSVN